MEWMDTNQDAQRLLDRKLARDVASDSGLILLREGMAVTADHLKMLIKHGVEKVAVSGQASFLDQLDAKCKAQHAAFVAAYRDQYNQLQALFKTAGRPGEEELANVLNSFETLAAEALESYSLFEVLQQLEGHDGYLLRHSIHVGIQSAFIAKLAGKSRDEILTFGKAGLLHDIGMLQMPKALFEQSRTLSEEEWNELKSHPAKGEQHLAETDVGGAVFEAVRDHHERMDGSGYPTGKTADEISEAGKITAVADVFDAVSSDRVYRKKASPIAALQEISREVFAGRLSAEHGMRFIDCMSSMYNGTDVLLSDGRLAKIVRLKATDLSNPLISINREVVDLKQLDGVWIADIADPRLLTHQGS
ncbi:HD-GYP domain-containing protein [Salisediminibacterium halotolerans]|uniref:HD-GYP domain, c-di-GMP phosphodiesterase class II (Or its inactivated variant) n=1 Tax=Salisediminibacterium halotolerans TaxID=517425 RepID=A0A1H9T9E1_9BACI|nr:HD domain-containing phosphohydrolase [Salisediminibacterium haloalkalitolerans]SER93554.1 HD-GYP domain, c-di-GMP phosphodiesterase class II (or its inactivated variant) [Salisediminibacterium haloalkalitolerans]